MTNTANETINAPYTAFAFELLKLYHLNGRYGKI